MECILLPSVADRARNCEPAPIPVVGEIYNYYDDGKVRTTRQFKALVTKVVPFDEVDEVDKKKWERDVRENDWSYAEKTDFFVYLKVTSGNGIIDARNYDGESISFVAVRDVNGSWAAWDFYWGGTLDVDGKLTEYLKDLCAKEGYPYYELIPMEKAREIFNHKNDEEGKHN